MTLQTNFSVAVEAVRATTLDKGVAKDLHQVAMELAWATGTAVSTADEVWSDSRTITAGAWANHVLDALPQLDNAAATQRTVDFAVIKLVFIRNISTAGNIIVAGGTNNGSAADAWALTGGMFVSDASMTAVPFGGGLLWYEPTGVAVGAGEILSIGAVGSNQTVEAIIIGEAS